MSNTYKVCVIDEAANKQQCVEIESYGVPMGVMATAITGILSLVSHLFGLRAKARAHR